MKNNYITLILILIFINTSYSQVGIGTATPNGALDVTSSTSGLLIPNVALTSRTASAPDVNPNGGGTPLVGTMVWNTATNGTAPDNVTPGFYYWNGIWYRKTDLIINSYLYPPTSINANTLYTLTGTIAGHSEYDGATVVLSGDWATSPNVTIEHVESRNGAVRFKVRNNSSGGGSINYTGMDFIITTFKY